MIYLDHAATTPVAREVADTMYDVLLNGSGNPSSQYPYGAAAKKRLEADRAVIAAALGCVSPCIIIISIIAAFLTNFQDNIYIKEAMNGIAICVVALILDAVLGLWKKGVKDKLGVALCAAVFVLMEFTSISPIPVIVGAALLGVVCKTLAAKKEAAK